MTNETGGAPAANPGWLKKALIASLAVNLLIVGGLAGSFISHQRHGGWHGRHGGGERGLIGFLRQLPQEKREALRPELERERERLKAMREAIKDAWSEANAAISAEPFDKEKLKAALGKQIESELKLRTAVSDAVAETAAKLDTAERQSLKEWREKFGNRKWGKRERRE